MPEEEEQKQQDWDKVKQEIDQYKSSAEKAKAEAEAAKLEAEKTKAENEAFAEQSQLLQSKIDALEKQMTARKEGDDYPELNPDYVDGNVIKTMQQMRSELKATKTELSKIQSENAERQKAEKTKAEEEYKEGIFKKVADNLDEKYSPKYRAEARKMAKKLVDLKEESVPNDSFDLMILLEKCYKKLAEKEKGKETVRTDTGEGGTVKVPSERKAGSLQEVLAEMKKDDSWKNIEHQEDKEFI